MVEQFLKNELNDWLELPEERHVAYDLDMKDSLSWYYRNSPNLTSRVIESFIYACEGKELEKLYWLIKECNMPLPVGVKISSSVSDHRFRVVERQ